jgi:cytochrome c-type biogenesis protein CcmH
MRRLVLALALTLGCALPILPALAVQPDEVLADPALEARARELSKLLRCPVCQSETIDESNAEVARDLRLLVRERLTAGDSDQAVLDYVVARYGEYVLFRPTAAGGNLALWLAGPAMLLVGAGIGLVFLRGRRPGAEPPAAALSEAEERRLQEILGE